MSGKSGADLTIGDAKGKNHTKNRTKNHAKNHTHPRSAKAIGFRGNGW
jgi:hypothetical protein